MTEANPLSELISGDASDWLSALPDYQRAVLDALLSAHDPVEAATIWLEGTGPSDTAPFGGIRAAAGNFYDNILRELQKLVCGGSDYEEERKAVAQSGRNGRLMLVGTVSSLIAPHVGAVAVIVGPAVALTFAVIGNASNKTVCEALADLISTREAAAAGSGGGGDA